LAALAVGGASAATTARIRRLHTRELGTGR
jgi:hypothetical protein